MSAILDSLRNQTPHPMFAERNAAHVARTAHAVNVARPAARPVQVTVKPAAKAATKQWTRADFDRVDAELLKVVPGRYALARREPSTGGNTITFLVVFESKRNSTVKHMIRQLVGAPGAFAERTLPLEHQYFAALHIAEDPKAAMIRYGLETKECGRCGSPLTNDKSRAAGIGPKCATYL
jgi:hypothetical protein